jgi:DNA helicase-2/ATP-dependent DNA helicase PcrA
MKFNHEQLKVIESKDKKIFLLSGAGTGKTTTIKAKIEWLLNQGVKVESILAITFTRKASIDLKYRIDKPGIQIRTFHSFCLDILTSVNQRKYQFCEDCDVVKPSTLLSISRYKNGSRLFPPFGYRKYQSFLEKNQLIDFDDIQNKLIQLLKKDSALLHSLHQKYKYIFVDEFQDTNAVQYKIIKLLTNESTYLLAVGDPDQSIYAFRGANPTIINKYIKYYKAKVYNLSYNYRSGKKIIGMANNLIRNNEERIPKSLKGFSQVESEVLIESFQSTNQENEFVLNKIRQLNIKGIDYEEMAIIYRTHQRGVKLKNYINEKLTSQDTRGINFISMHQAKGLEFIAVFVLGCEENTVPSYLAKTSKELEEERRLFYVSITRSKQYLYLTSIGKKSPFLKEIKLSKINKQTYNQTYS